MATPTMNVHTLALEKVGKILGPVRARMLLDSFLHRREQDHLTCPADLHAFGEDLSLYGGTEEAIGALICRQAVLLGADNNQED